MKLGAHVDQSDPVAAAVAAEADCIQFFLGDPQGWQGPQFPWPGGAAGLRAAAEAAGVDLYIHAPYIINVATTNNRVRIPSRKLLQQQLDAAALVGAKGLIVHGGHVGESGDPMVGFVNWRKAIDGADMKVPLLIENTAGGAHAVARTLEGIDALWTAIGEAEGGDTVGLCLDTCHAFAGGEQLDGIVARVRAITGRIDLIHCNDSKGGFGSGADRHANLGRGLIDPAEIVAVLEAAKAPVILETPFVGIGEDLEWLRDHV